MISRLTASAVLFAIVAATGLAFAADVRRTAAAAPAATAQANAIIVLPTLIVTGRRLAAH